MKNKHIKQADEFIQLAKEVLVQNNFQTMVLDYLRKAQDELKQV